MKEKFVNNLTIENRIMSFGRYNVDFQKWIEDNWNNTISEILSIDMTSLNTLDAVDEFLFEISSSNIPSDKYISEIFIEIVEVPESYAYGYSESVQVLSIELLNLYDTNSVGKYPKNSNTAVKLTLDANNPQDWITGEIKVYGRFKKVPEF